MYGLIFQILLATLGEVSVLPWSGSPLQYCCSWPEQLYSTLLLLIKLGTKIPELASWRLRTAFLFSVTYTNFFSCIWSHLWSIRWDWWLLRWLVLVCLRRLPMHSWWIDFFQSLVCFYLFIIFFSRIFKIPHKLSHIYFCSYKLY